MKMTADGKNLHAGHRDRMRRRYLENGPAAFADHELLEMLLFYAIPRGNTNETAHLLLQQFDRMEDIVNASTRHLTAVHGIGDHAAILLSLVGEMFRRIAKQNVECPREYDRNNLETIVRYLGNLFIGDTVEKAYLMLFDNSLRMLDCVCLGEGSINTVHLAPKSILEHAMRKNVSAVLLAHNHPKGVAVPSAEDIETTHHLKNLLATVDVVLLDHLIFADNCYLPVLNDLGDEPMAVSVSVPVQTVSNPFYRTYVERYAKNVSQSGRPNARCARRKKRT